MASNGSYVYTLTKPFDTTPDSATTAAQTEVAESFTYVVTDANGNSTTGTITVNIVDDVPTARPDTDDVGTGNTATGNVMTDASAGDGADTDVNAADTPGADGALVTHVKSDNPGGSPRPRFGASVTINGQYGTLTLEADGDYTYTRTSSSAGTDVFTYTLTDGDGDTDTATLTVALDATGILVVGSNESDDNEASDPAHTVSAPSPLDNNGPVEGLGGNDILVGDPGAVTLTAGDKANIILVLDTSGSMTTKIDGNGDGDNDDGGDPTRMQALINSVNALLNNLAASGAANVRVHIIEFDSDANSLGTFDLRGGTAVQNATQLANAHTAINGLTANDSTNYEAGLQLAIDYIAAGGIDPLVGANVNKLLFVSDGQPTGSLDDNSTDQGDVVSTNTSESLQHILGTGQNDTVNEVLVIETDSDGGGTDIAFTIEAIGIGMGADGASALESGLDVLDQVEGAPVGNVGPPNTHVAVDINNTADLTTQIGALGGGSAVASAAGNDIVNGGAGNDVIFGDVMNTELAGHRKRLRVHSGRLRLGCVPATRGRAGKYRQHSIRSGWRRRRLDPRRHRCLHSRQSGCIGGRGPAHWRQRYHHWRPG